MRISQVISLIRTFINWLWSLVKTVKLTAVVVGVMVLEPDRFEDERGFFLESFEQERYRELGIVEDFVQDNHSRSVKGVLRGLHMQKGDAAQAKLVRVIEGAVLDIAVDLRKGSPSFGQHYAIELTADNHKQFFVPSGFAHGFVVLTETATFLYKVDKFYQPGNEVGIMYNDKDLNIDWKLPTSELIFSEKDKTLGSFAEYAASL